MIIVVGGGIAGLTSAFRLQQHGHRVTVLDQAAEGLVGGRMATVYRDGYAIDLGGPLLGRAYKPLAQLVADVGLAPDVLLASDLTAIRHAGRTYAGRTGTLGRLLSGSLLSAAPLHDRMRVIRDLYRHRRQLHPADMTQAPDDFTLTEYAARRRLRSSTLDALLDPAACTLSLTEPESASMAAALLYLAFWATSKGLLTFPGGSGVLPRRIAELVTVVPEVCVTSVEQSPRNVTVTYRSARGAECVEVCDAAVLAVSPPAAAALFQQLPTPARDAFAATRYSPTIQVTFCLDAPTRDRTVMLHVARSEHSPVASFFLPHNLSPQRVREGTAMVTAYLRGEAAEKLWTARQSRVIDTVLASLDIVDSFREIECDTRAVYVDRIPQAVVRRHPGDYAMLRLARQALQGSGGRISLAGGDYYGHSTVVGSIASGDGAARLIAGRYESCRRQISPQSLGWRASSMPRKPVSTDPS